jgi:photosystem II stability/assembly factor-like uncharacterized protein
MKIWDPKLTILAIVLAFAAFYNQLLPPAESVPAPAREPSFRDNLYDVAIAPEHAWIVGYYGTILRSSDRGLTWAVQQSGTREALFRVDFIDGAVGWVAGSHGTLLYTSDGGDTWQPRKAPVDEHLFGLSFIDRRHGWAVGSRGTVLATEDGGRTWDNRSLAEDVTLNDVRFIDSKRGWVVGEFGRIYASKDGGRTWTKQNSPVEVSLVSGESRNLFRLLMAESGTGWAFGLDGLILSTENGVTWQAAKPDGTDSDSGGGAKRYHLFSAATAGGSMFAVGERGTVLVSSIKNPDWSQSGLQGPPLSLNGISFRGELGIIVGNRGAILRSVNAGKSWEQVRTGASRAGYGNGPPQ